MGSQTRAQRCSASRAAAAVLLAAFAAVSAASAEELILKGGQKIVGKIVGFENDMFRVETEYGFALVRKDKVEKVNFSSGVNPGEAPKKAKAGATSSSPPAPRTASAAPQPESAAKQAADPAKPVPAPAKSPAVPPPPSRPLDEPLPPSLREHVEGTTYVNDSLHFALFKPPGWKVFEEVPKETGAAVMAIGTEDEQTILFVDRQIWSGTPDFRSESAEANLRATYEQYRKILESPMELDGHPAVRRQFKGVIDGVEWHGISVHVAHGNTVFGIIGLTSAETYQFQQALFNKIISSFRFLAPPSPSASRPSYPARP